MIQNFAFAVENLSLIGIWLRTEDVNGVIKPNLTALLDLGKKFDKEKEVKDAIEEIFLMHGQDLEATEASNIEKDPAERVDVKIDLQSLISDIQSVSSKAFGLQVDNVPAVLQAFQNDPKISADELRKVKAGSLAPKMPDSSGKQSPLGGMLGPVPGGDMQSGQNQSPSQKSSSPKGHNDQERLSSLSGRLTADLMALNEVIPISDFIVIDAQMPLGFLVDVPDSMNVCKGNHLSQEQADFRERIWPILAMFSGQCNLDVVNKCTVSSKWLQAINAGEDALRELCTSQGIAVRSGCVYLHSMQIWEAIGDRSGGSAFMKVLSTITEFYSIYPEKAMTPFKLLYTS